MKSHFMLFILSLVAQPFTSCTTFERCHAQLFKMIFQFFLSLKAQTSKLEISYIIWQTLLQTYFMNTTFSNFTFFKVLSSLLFISLWRLPEEMTIGRYSWIIVIVVEHSFFRNGRTDLCSFLSDWNQRYCFSKWFLNPVSW